jgi:hypothetical protein
MSLVKSQNTDSVFTYRKLLRSNDLPRRRCSAPRQTFTTNDENGGRGEIAHIHLATRGSVSATAGSKITAMKRAH